MKEFIISSIIFIVVIIRLLFKNRKLKNEIRIECAKASKYNDLYKIMAQWMEVKQNGQSIAVWLRENNYDTVAIYGVYLIGERLYVDLMDEGVNVLYGIDGKSRAYIEGIQIYKPTDKLPDADIIIVTAVSDYETIKKKLESKVSGKIYSIENILKEVSIQ